MSNSLIEKLLENAGSEMYPFHMPGHKRRTLGFGAEILPFALDVTEVNGFDNLQNPQSVLKELEETAALHFCSKKAFVLVNGSTCGVLASVRAMTKRGDRVLLARNCHKSVYNAVELCGLIPEYVMPKRAFDGDRPLNFYGVIDPSDVEKALCSHPDTSLVIITSPTYEGMCSDISRISEICHHYDAMLLVDEAHGAININSSAQATFENVFFPKPAVMQGADAVVLSLHKTFPALTQTALLMTNNEALIPAFRQNIAMFQTSSPSYILMASVESCLSSLNNSKAFFEYWQRLQRFYDEADETEKIEVLFRKKQSIHDSGKILLSSAKTDINGYELAKLLREKYLIETEMATPDYVLAYSTFADTDEGFKRLINALKQIDNQCGRIKGAPDTAFISELPQQAFIPSEKYNFNIRTVPLSKSKGSAAAETVVAYPPGSPCVAAGEVITGEIIEYIKQIKSMGGELIYDSYSHDSEMINVAEL